MAGQGKELSTLARKGGEWMAEALADRLGFRSPPGLEGRTTGVRLEFETCGSHRTDSDTGVGIWHCLTRPPGIGIL